MDYFVLEAMRRSHPAWRLLAADHAPLIAAFLYQSFVQPNVRTLAQQAIASRLEDLLYHLRERLGAAAFPKTAMDYVDNWASDTHGWLRKYYPAGSDEPHFDLTSSAEKAIDWLLSLRERQFVGAESRLMTVFELLRQMVEGTETDPEARIAELERRRNRIEAEIRQIREGHLNLMDPTQVKDRFLQMETTARGLLADFREVEQNFRNLDRGTREQIATWEGGKAQLLDRIFGGRDAIADSDQGKSFKAFWDFLMSPERQDEFSALLDSAFGLSAVRELNPDERLRRIHYDWLEAGEVAQRTVARLSEQLRRYLDDQAWLENRRIMQLIREIEGHALAVRERSPENTSFMMLDEPAPDIELAMERPMFSPPLRPDIREQILLEGDEPVSVDALFEQVYVDKARLMAHVHRKLQMCDQISLADLVADQPVEQGLAEVVAYLSLAADNDKALIDDSGTETIAWTDDTGQRRATLPLVVFRR